MQRGSIEDIQNRFNYHPPDAKRKEVHEEVRARYKELALALTTLCPRSPELSLALTNLEQSMFWANASVARNS